MPLGFKSRLKSLVPAALAGVALMSSAPAAAQDSCPALRWTTLGTAGGPIPTPERAEPSNLLTADGERLLVDAGDGTVNQLAKIGVTLAPIKAVFLSHHHWDHTGGLAAIIGLRWMNSVPGVLTVYGPPGTRELVDGILASLGPLSRVGFGVGAPPPPPASTIAVTELVNGSVVKLGSLTVRAGENSHFSGQDSRAAGEAVSLSFRFELGARAITYTGDTGPSDAVTRLAKGSDLLVSEVIDLERTLAAAPAAFARDPKILRQIEQHLATHHLTGEDIGKIAANAGAKRVLLTHFAIPAGPLLPSEPRLRAGIAKNYAGPVDIGMDLASYDIGCAARER